MSVEAMVWALTLAPVPYEQTGRGRPPKNGPRRPQPSSACAFVLLGLANHAGQDGRNAFPSVRTLCRYTRLGERTVQLCLDRLETAGIIRRGNQAIVAAYIPRADHRPTNYNLDLTLIRDDLTDDQLRKIGEDSPFLAATITTHEQEPPTPDEAADTADTDAPDRTTAADTTGRNDSTGCSHYHHGVQSLPPRGAMTAPEPSPLTPPLTPPSPPTGTSPRAREDTDDHNPPACRRPPHLGPDPIAARAARDRADTASITDRDGYPPHPHEPHTLAWAHRTVMDSRLPIDAYELTSWAYRAGHGDPWHGHWAIQIATTRDLTTTDPTATLRARLRTITPTTPIPPDTTTRTRATQAEREAVPPPPAYLTARKTMKRRTP